MGWFKERRERRAAERAAGMTDPASTHQHTSAVRPLPFDGRPITPTWSAERGRPPWMYDQMRVTLFNGSDDLEVVGESNYQDALWSVAGRTSDRVRIETVAVLVAEDGNRYDANAVSVWVAGNKVGYLRRDDAEAIRPELIRKVVETGQPVAFEAVVAGGG